jgi:uncharacterized alkaline shock family protein YloU
MTTDPAWDADETPAGAPAGSGAPEGASAALGDDTLDEDAAEVTPKLSVGRGVIVEVARLAALEVPDVLRVARRGPRWRAALAGPPVTVRVRPDGVDVRLRIIARPGADLAATGRRVRESVGRAVERLLGLHVNDVSVLIDGVGT